MLGINKFLHRLTSWSPWEFSRTLRGFPNEFLSLDYYFTLTIISKRSLKLKKGELELSIIRRIVLTLAAAGLIVGFVACEKEGLMEKAGKKADQTVEDVQKVIKKKTE